MNGIPAWTPIDPSDVADALVGKGDPRNEQVRLAVREMYGQVMRGKWAGAMAEIQDDLRAGRYDRIVQLHERIALWWHRIAISDGPLPGMPSRADMVSLAGEIERVQRHVLQNLGVPPSRGVAPIAFWSGRISDAMPPDGTVIADPGDYRVRDVIWFGKYPAIVVYGVFDDLTETPDGIFRTALAYPFMRLIAGKLAPASSDDVGIFRGVEASDMPDLPKPVGDLHPLPPRSYLVPVAPATANKVGAAQTLARGLDSLGYTDVGLASKKDAPHRSYSYKFGPARVAWIKP